MRDHNLYFCGYDWLVGCFKFKALWDSLSVYTELSLREICCCCCVVVQRPRQTSKVMSGQSVNLT